MILNSGNSFAYYAKCILLFVTGSVGKILKRKCDLWTGIVELPYRFHLIRLIQSLKVVKNPYPETHIHQYLNSAERNIINVWILLQIICVTEGSCELWSKWSLPWASSIWPLPLEFTMSFCSWLGLCAVI